MLEIKHISKCFERFRISDISLTIQRHDYFMLLGASGAGKSVLLEIIAGLVKPDAGEIFLRGENITTWPLHRRKTGLIFQTPAIFPNLSVKQNLLFPLKNQPKTIAIQKSGLLAQQMGIDHLMEARPAVLSGGELQRLALARTLASDPVMLLLDEPLSAVDTPMKSGLRGLLRNINQQGMPVLHVTHDYEEAIALGSQMAVLENGTIIQTGTPQQVMSNPKSGFTAGFTGEHNFYKVILHQGKAIINTENYVSEQIVIQLNDHYEDGPAQMLIRSKHVVISLHEPDMSTTNNFKGIIRNIIPWRDGYEVEIENNIRIMARVTPETVERMQLTNGVSVWACFKASAVEIIL